MRFEATGNRGADLRDETRLRSGNSEKAIFHLTIGREYTAYAMALWPDGLGALVISDRGKTAWYSLDLFKVINGGLPAGWRFGSNDLGGSVLALWGYQSLVDDPLHHDALVDRDPNAIRAFLAECDRSDLTDHDRRALLALERAFPHER